MCVHMLCRGGLSLACPPSGTEEYVVCEQECRLYYRPEELSIATPVTCCQSRGGRTGEGQS